MALDGLTPASVVCATFPTTLFNFLSICFNTAAAQPASPAMTFCGLPSLWSVLMIVIQITVESTVFPMIVVTFIELDGDSYIV